MNDTVTYYTTADGWTIDASMTIAARAARWVRVTGSKAKAAKKHGLSLAELRKMLTDHRLPPAPVVTPEARAVLARPLPVLVVPPPGRATEADLIRLSEFAVSVTRDYQKVDWVLGCTLYEPPAEFEAARDALLALRRQAEKAIADIRATTPAGIRAKGCALMSGFDPDASSLDDHPLARSILADCGVDDWSRGGSPGWIGERHGTVQV